MSQTYKNAAAVSKPKVDSYVFSSAAGERIIPASSSEALTQTKLTMGVFVTHCVA